MLTDAAFSALVKGEVVVDSVSPALRSEIMSRVLSKNTRPEMVVRRMLHKAGYRYRLHRAGLPGKPDLVFVGRKKVIFVHGCFWHMHEGCAQARIPKSRVEFWTTKLRSNKERDERNLAELERLGWQTLVVWECDLQKPNLLEQIRRFLDDHKRC